MFFALPFYPVRLPSTLKDKPRYHRLKAIDWVGNLLALGMTVTLVLPMQWGGYIMPWDDPRIIILFVVVRILPSPFPSERPRKLTRRLDSSFQCGALLGLFVLWELWIAKRGHAVVPLRMLKNRSVSGAASSGFFLNVVYGVSATYLPLLYQARGASALRSGINILPLMISSVVVLLVSGVCVKKLGYYKPWLVGGPLLASIGAGCLTNPDLLTDPKLIGWQILIGLGFGVAFQNTSAYESSVTRV